MPLWVIIKSEVVYKKSFQTISSFPPQWEKFLNWPWRRIGAPDVFIEVFEDFSEMQWGIFRNCNTFRQHKQHGTKKEIREKMTRSCDRGPMIIMKGKYTLTERSNPLRLERRVVLSYLDFWIWTSRRTEAFFQQFYWVEVSRCSCLFGWSFFIEEPWRWPSDSVFILDFFYVWSHLIWFCVFWRNLRIICLIPRSDYDAATGRRVLRRIFVSKIRSSAFSSSLRVFTN